MKQGQWHDQWHGLPLMRLTPARCVGMALVIVSAALVRAHAPISRRLAAPLPSAGDESQFLVLQLYKLPIQCRLDPLLSLKTCFQRRGMPRRWMPGCRETQRASSSASPARPRPTAHAAAPLPP